MKLSAPLQNPSIENDGRSSIRDFYPDYEATFVILHPFLKINEGSTLVFETGKWPTKREIVDGTSVVTWTEIVKESGLKDIKELDRLLAFLHCAYRVADKEGWIKLMSYVQSNDLIVAQVDDFPEILIDSTLEYLKSLGYHEVFHFSDVDESRTLYSIQMLIDDENKLIEPCPRILTQDHKILFETDFDSRVTYFSSTIEIIEAMVSSLNFEGFYCDMNTKAYWSHGEQTTDLIDWNSEERYRTYN